MAGFGIPFLDKNVLPFPATIPTAEAAAVKRAKVKFFPMHGPEYQAQTARSAITYIGANLIYVAAFIMLTLIIFWTLGKKAAFYFLLLVLAGQLVLNASTIQALLPKG